jgi:hypothetical protein
MVIQDKQFSKFTFVLNLGQLWLRLNGKNKISLNFQSYRYFIKRNRAGLLE